MGGLWCCVFVVRCVETSLVAVCASHFVSANMSCLVGGWKCVRCGGVDVVLCVHLVGLVLLDGTCVCDCIVIFRLVWRLSVGVNLCFGKSVKDNGFGM